MPTDTLTPDVALPDAVDDTDPDQLYDTFHTASETFARTISKGVVIPAAKQHFEDDRGHSLKQVLPDKPEEYVFESHGFGALVLPDQQRVVNHSYNGVALNSSSVANNPDALTGIGEAAESLWADTFGAWRRMVNQPDHPGPFPLDADALSNTLDTLSTLREIVVDDPPLSVIADAAATNDIGLIAEMYETTREEILTPGGTDLSALPDSEDVTVPYNDGEIAVLRPVSRNESQSTPTRGVIIGYDDTPVGIFAHVTDVTNLNPDQLTTRDALRDAMGFDNEISPFNPPAKLDISDGERVRIQGDLRVERTGVPADFPDELARRTRRTEYRETVDAVLDAAEIPSRYVRGKRDDVTVGDVLDFEVTPSGGVSLDPAISDMTVELLAYIHLLFELGTPTAEPYSDYTDIMDIKHPGSVMRGQDMAVNGLRNAVQWAREQVRQALGEVTDSIAYRVEQEARNVAAEVEAGLDVPQQVNLPIDNHMTFIEAGYAPDVDTEPVPVGVPEQTTLHILHDEHNTITVQIDPGVYRFSLLPRGLQPPEERPDWPAPE